MMFRAILGLAILCASVTLHAQDARHRKSVEVFIEKEHFHRLEVAEGAATLTVGPYFPFSNMQSKQDTVRVTFEYVRFADALIDKLTLKDMQGNTIGEYTLTGLKLDSQ